MKNILILTDYSDASRKAVEFALHLYKDLNCSFTVLNHYAELPLSTNQVDAAVDFNAQSRIDAYVEEFRQQFAPSSSSFKGTAMGGSLVGALKSLYEKEPFDVVVVGASGTGKSVRLGSVATEVIRVARYPVLVVPASISFQPIQNIVIATDYRSFHSVDVFGPIKELVKGGIRELAFLQVLAPDSSKTAVDDSGKAVLDEYFKEHEPSHYYIHNESPVEGIETFLGRYPTDLLVTVSHHHSLWDLFLNRSTSRTLAYGAKVPLLVLFEVEAASDSSDDLPLPDWNVLP